MCEMIYIGFVFLIPFSLVFAQEMKKNDDAFAQMPITVQDANSVNVQDMAIPEPMIDEPTETVADTNVFDEEEPAGIDTVSLEDAQGNWLFKKIWWERAEN